MSSSGFGKEHTADTPATSPCVVGTSIIIEMETRRRFVASNQFQCLLIFYCLFFQNCPTNCPACREPLDAPAKLPCTHVLCAMCARQNETCPTDNCDQKIPSGFDYKPEEDTDIEYVVNIHHFEYPFTIKIAEEEVAWMVTAHALPLSIQKSG